MDVFGITPFLSVAREVVLHADDEGEVVNVRILVRRRGVVRDAPRGRRAARGAIVTVVRLSLFERYVQV